MLVGYFIRLVDAHMRLAVLLLTWVVVLCTMYIHSLAFLRITSYCFFCFCLLVFSLVLAATASFFCFTSPWDEWKETMRCSMVNDTSPSQFFSESNTYECSGAACIPTSMYCNDVGNLAVV